MELFGKPSKFIFENVVDFDLSSLYPSIIRAFNIDGSTQIGRLIIEDHFNNLSGDQLLEYLNSKNFIEICRRALDLPSTEDLITAIKEGKK